MNAPKQKLPRRRLSPDSLDKEGLKDFFKVYMSAYEEISAALMQQVAQIPELEPILRQLTPEVLAQQSAQSLERMRKALLEGEWEPYLAAQRKNAETYAQAEVPLLVWFEITVDFERLLVPRLVEQFKSDPERLSNVLLTSHRFVELALAEITDGYLETKESLILQQQRALVELSTPVLQVRDRMLILPIIGILDTRRARQLTAQLLSGIRAARARVVVMDITGVPAVDSKVANHLLQTVAAARLMGASVVVSGVSPEVAQALVMLGVDLERLRTVGDLQGGIELAESLLGYVVTQAAPKAPEEI